VQTRTFGSTGITLSTLTFGTMRLDPESITGGSAEELLLFLIDNGVSAFHSSREYASHDFFCTLLRRVRSLRPHAQFQHIAKVGVPHFDQKKFSGAALRTIIESQLGQLGTERIDIVQWLVRQTPNEDALRLAVLRDSIEEVASTFNELRREGKVGALASFPYTRPFADQVLNYELCSGLVTYLNPAELEYVGNLDVASVGHKGFVAIRPLLAGRLCDDADTDFAQVRQKIKDLAGGSELARFSLEFPLWHPAVSSIVLSLSSIEHAKEAIAVASETRAEPERFFRAIDYLRA
jgi:aryl-alcohol dehydrogenase-like predicted oxidoreductase